MKTCTTHHRACDCREATHTAQVHELRTENKRLRAALRFVVARGDAHIQTGYMASDCLEDAWNAAKSALARRKR